MIKKAIDAIINDFYDTNVPLALFGANEISRLMLENPNLDKKIEFVVDNYKTGFLCNKPIVTPKELTNFNGILFINVIKAANEIDEQLRQMQLTSCKAISLKKYLENSYLLESTENINNTLYFKKDYWKKENLLYTSAHYRLQRVAQVINCISSKTEQKDLLDVGCGPATLATLLNSNIHYHGIDIALQKSGLQFLEKDIIGEAIDFKNKKFDFVIASGLLEYLGNNQVQKFEEIFNSLKNNGYFITTFSNLDHIQQPRYPSWNNYQTIDSLLHDFRLFFRVEKYYPGSHNIAFKEPSNKLIKKIQSCLCYEIPYFSKRFAVHYIFICKKVI